MLRVVGNVSLCFDDRSNSTDREVLLGITGKDFVILAASKAAMRGPTILKSEDDKTRHLNKHTLMAYSGEPGDTGSSSSNIHTPPRQCSTYSTGRDCP